MWCTVFAVVACWLIWRLFARSLLYAVTSESKVRHITDVTPDYPGGVAGFIYLVSNVAAAALALFVIFKALIG